MTSKRTERSEPFSTPAARAKLLLPVMLTLVSLSVLKKQVSFWRASKRT